MMKSTFQLLCVQIILTTALCLNPNRVTLSISPDLVVLAGETAVLRCSVQSNIYGKSIRHLTRWGQEIETPLQPPGIKNSGVAWEKTNQSLLLTFNNQRMIRDDRYSIENPHSNVWELHIRNVNIRDQGEYRCRSAIGSTYKSVKLTVIDPSSNNNNINITIKEGNTATLPCGIKNKNAGGSVRWLRDSFPITIGAFVFHNDPRYSVSMPTPTSSDLLIKNVKKADEGSYECRVEPRHCQKDCVYKLRLIVQESKNMIKLEGPTFVEKGSPIKLTCTTFSDDDHTVDWFFDGKRIVLNEETSVSTGLGDDNLQVNVLDISPSRLNNSGTYVCRSSNYLVESLKVVVLNTGSTNTKRRENRVETTKLPTTSRLNATTTTTNESTYNESTTLRPNGDNQKPLLQTTAESFYKFNESTTLRPNEDNQKPLLQLDIHLTLMMCNGQLKNMNCSTNVNLKGSSIIPLCIKVKGLVDSIN